MKEKTGHTIKLKFDFNESRCCEIYLENRDRYHRVTPNEFRSFGGKRRILEIQKSGNAHYEEFKGPVYYLGTNTQVPSDELASKIMLLNNVDPRKFGVKRKWENFD